jgi:hypothetical protein
MSNLSITEYESVGRDIQGSPLPAGQVPAVAIQNITFTTSATQSAAFNTKTVFIRVVSDVDCRLVFGTDPTADQTSTLLASGQAEYFGIAKLGGPYKLSVIEVV